MQHNHVKKNELLQHFSDFWRNDNSHRNIANDKKTNPNKEHKGRLLVHLNYLNWTTDLFSIACSN